MIQVSSDQLSENNESITNYDVNKEEQRGSVVVC